MTTAQTTKPVSQSVETLIGAALELGESLARLGAAALAIPLALLPPKARTDAVQAVHDVVDAVGRVNTSAIKAVTRVSDTWLKELDTAVAAAAESTPPALAAAPETK